jgi:(2Fe-2S) ferredoxin
VILDDWQPVKAIASQAAYGMRTFRSAGAPAQAVGGRAARKRSGAFASGAPRRRVPLSVRAVRAGSGAVDRLRMPRAAAAVPARWRCRARDADARTRHAHHAGRGRGRGARLHRQDLQAAGLGAGARGRLRSSTARLGEGEDAAAPLDAGSPRSGPARRGRRCVNLPQAGCNRSPCAKASSIQAYRGARRPPQPHGSRPARTPLPPPPPPPKIARFGQDLGLPGIDVAAGGCLGNCGAGPNVSVSPPGVVLRHVATPADFAEAMRASCGAAVDDRVRRARAPPAQRWPAVPARDAGRAALRRACMHVTGRARGRAGRAGHGLRARPRLPRPHCPTAPLPPSPRSSGRPSCGWQATPRQWAATWRARQSSERGAAAGPLAAVGAGRRPDCPQACFACVRACVHTHAPTIHTHMHGHTHTHTHTHTRTHTRTHTHTRMHMGTHKPRPHRTARV